MAASPNRAQEMRTRYLTGEIGYEEAKDELVIVLAERFFHTRWSFSKNGKSIRMIFGICFGKALRSFRLKYKCDCRSGPRKLGVGPLKSHKET